LKRKLQRVGCGSLVVIWFILLLTPCLFVVLATQREIVLTHSDIPNDDFRVWLIQERGHHGIALSNSRRVSAANDAACILIDVRFIMWQGTGDPNHYCSCYTRQNNRWVSIAEGPEACKLAGE
jgi:hypothetical protein